MSASNWAVCPRCFDQARRVFAVESAKLEETYGVVPLADFDAVRARLAPPNPEDFHTFREDWEFYGAERGEVTADYSGHCSKCGLGLDFKETRKFFEATEWSA